MTYVLMATLNPTHSLEIVKHVTKARDHKATSLKAKAKVKVKVAKKEPK